jgi:transcriptional regulator with GAF, ATPase, and Fis domain
MPATLKAISGPFTGSTFPLRGIVSIGRDPGNGITLTDPVLSRRHCLFREDARGFHLSDLQSVNHTYVNGEQIENRLLADGDEIRFGRSVFHFAIDAQAVTVPDAPVWANIDPPSDTMVLRLEDSVYLHTNPPGDGTKLALGAILRLAQAIPSIAAIDELQQHIMDAAGQATPAECGAIILGNDDSETVFLWRKNGSPERTSPVSRTLVERVRDERVAILCTDVPGTMPQSESLVRLEVRSLIAVPLLSREKLIGAITLASANLASPLRKEDLEFVTAVAGMAAGVFERALELQEIKSENQRLRSEIQLNHSMVGESTRMRAVYDFVSRAAPSDSTVLILGESGTGKEMVARAIHQNSMRSEAPFVAINCASLTEALLESELFGHERGAFTGAVAQKKGKLEIAAGGTVFLDEIGELAPTLQARLLRVLQEREFERVGGTRPIKADVRVIAATNRDLKEAAERKEFRPDLYYRLNVIALQMPALRERRKDIPLLAMHFARKHGERVKRRITGISREAEELLAAYDWPGNVRELENAIERAIVLGSLEEIGAEDLPESVGEATTIAGASSFTELLKEAKRRIVLDTIQNAGGNCSEAARQLGLHPNNLQRLIRNLNLRDQVRG